MGKSRNVGEKHGLYGKKHKPETIMKMKLIKIKENNPMYSKKHSTEAIMKMKLIKMGENNPHWKGDNAKYSAIHIWIRQNFSPKSELCQICNIKKFNDLANITGIYNRDFINWKYLCRSCHMKLDYQNGLRTRDRNKC